MKNMHILALLVSLLTGVSVFATEPMIPSAHRAPIANLNVSEPMNFGRVNTLLQALTNQVIASEAQLKMAYPEFDTRLSSFDQERIVYSMKGSLENTNWGADAKLSGITDYQVNRDPDNSGISVKYSAQVDTDLFALFRYTATTVKKSNTFINHDPHRLPILNRAEQVTTMSDLYQVLSDSLRDAINESNKEITYWNAHGDCLRQMTCGTPMVDQWGNRVYDYVAVLGNELYVEGIKRLRASFETTTIEFDPALNQITIHCPAPQGFLKEVRESEVKFSKVVITENQITLNGNLFVTSRTADLDRVHKSLYENLNGLSLGDQASADEIQAKFRRALISFKNVLNYNHQ